MDHALLPARRETPASPAAIVRGFLRWTRSASATARAQGTRALARAYLGQKLDPAQRREALLALTALLDDPSPLVRMALAEVLGPSPAAPRALVIALAADGPAIASRVLTASPLLGDADLADAAAAGCAATQAAVAARATVSPAMSAALAEFGDAQACAILCANPGAALTPAALGRLAARHADDADLREVLLRRPDLPPGLRHDLVVATARTLAGFVADRHWVSPQAAGRLVRDATERACLTIAASAGTEDPEAAPRLVAHLLAAGQLTPALLLRGVVAGDLGLFEAAASRLSGIPLGRVAGLLRGGRTVGFAALYGRARLPAALLPVFQAALFCCPDPSSGTPAARERIAAALRACAGIEDPQLDRTAALLRRLDAEAAREEARRFAREVATPLPFLPRPSRPGRASGGPAWAERNAA